MPLPYACFAQSVDDGGLPIKATGSLWYGISKSCAHLATVTASNAGGTVTEGVLDEPCPLHDFSWGIGAPGANLQGIQ